MAKKVFNRMSQPKANSTSGQLKIKGGTIIFIRRFSVRVPTEKAAEAERLWRQDCGPLMLKQPGCVSEQFLRGRENPGEFVSLATWEDQAAIDRYRSSDAHKAIQQHTR